MPKGNKANSDIVEKLRQAQALLDECMAEIGNKQTRKPSKKAALMSSSKASIAALDFDMPMRAFIKKNARGLSGTKKFVLLIARLSKGNPKKEVSLQDIQRQWNRMKSKFLMALDFNTFFSTEAREKDWVESKRKGFYNLRPSWKSTFN